MFIYWENCSDLRLHIPSWHSKPLISSHGFMELHDSLTCLAQTKQQPHWSLINPTPTWQWAVSQVSGHFNGHVGITSCDDDIPIQIVMTCLIMVWLVIWLALTVVVYYFLNNVCLFYKIVVVSEETRILISQLWWFSVIFWSWTYFIFTTALELIFSQSK